MKEKCNHCDDSHETTIIVGKENIITTIIIVIGTPLILIVNNASLMNVFHVLFITGLFFFYYFKNMAKDGLLLQITRLLRKADEEIVELQDSEFNIKLKQTCEKTEIHTKDQEEE